MKIGVIDVGSNTIKAFVYDVCKTKIETLASERYYTHLYSYIVDNKISDDGISALCNDIIKCKRFLKENDCDEILCFATAAMRDAKNNDKVIFEIKRKCGINVDLISGKDEAICDIYSMKYVYGVNSALGMDMGGGSAQIFRYDNDDIYFSVSLPLGALKIKQMFVSDKFPNEIETENIKRYVNKILSSITPTVTDRMYAMGGSIVELTKVFNLYDNKITPSMLLALKNKLELMQGLEEYLNKVATGREYTIIPAIIALCSISEYFKIKEFVVIENGVREGYIYKKIIQ